jgi:hypothetical protein
MAAAWLLVAAACSSAPQCEPKLRAAQTSPDGKLQAAILDVGCGASSGAATWVLLTDANVKFNNAADKVAVFKGSVERVAWKDGALLVIYGRAKPSATPATAKGVPINYFESEQPTDLGALR